MRINPCARERHRRVSTLGLSLMAMAVLWVLVVLLTTAIEAAVHRHCGPGSLDNEAPAARQSLIAAVRSCLRTPTDHTH